jgi:hypothetical protein
MLVIKSSRIVFCDVDDTLVMWNWKDYSPDGVGLIGITDPNDNVTVAVLPHFRHIEMIKQFKARGHTIVVWSQGGWAWAESVVKTLGIEHMVDLVIDKPSWYIDDLPASAFMQNPTYLHPTDPSKDKSSWIKFQDDKD